MIDIHTHVLPYIDDGAKDNLEAIKMTECMEHKVYKWLSVPLILILQNNPWKIFFLKEKKQFWL